jgi:RHS repeat-associated protein
MYAGSGLRPVVLILRVFVGFLCLAAFSGLLAMAQTPEPQNSTQSVPATLIGTGRQPLSWVVLLNGQQIASNTSPNGWSAAGSYSIVLGRPVATIGLVIPANAAIATGYVVNAATISIPPNVVSAHFNVVANPLQLVPSTVSGYQGSTGTITLANPAPAGGLTITLSSDRSTATVPASITAAAGATRATFSITTSPAATRATITAQYTISGRNTTLSANLTELANSFPNDIPPPAWAAGIVPYDSTGVGGFGPSAADNVNLASGSEENTPGIDIGCYNSVGPAAVFGRMYRTATAANGYGTPGLPPGWTHNYDVTALSATGGWFPVILKYASGATETWTPQTNANGLPTGVFTLPSGTPYLATGQPDPFIAGHWLALTITFKDHSTWTLSPDPANNTNYRLTQITNLVGHSINLQYDNNEHLISVSNDLQTNGMPTPVTLLSLSYVGGFLSSVTDAFGRTITYTIQGTLNAVSIINTPNIAQWSYSYTAVNNWTLLASTSQPDPRPGNDGSQMLSNSIIYDGQGRVSTFTDANGNVHQYQYPANAPTSVTFKAAGAQQTSAVDPNYSQLLGSFNNMTGTMDRVGNSDQIQYGDPQNPYLPTSYINRNNQMVTASYDGYGNLTQTVAPRMTTTYSFDYTTFALGQLKSVTAAYGAGSYGISYTYYPNGQIETVNTPDPSGLQAGATVTFTYTALGNIATVTAPGPNTTGAAVTYTYYYTLDPTDNTTQPEALGEPLAVKDPNGNFTHFRWDNRGNLLAVIDGVGNRWDYTYDPNTDQLVATQAPLNGTGRLSINTRYLYLDGPATQVVLNDTNGNPFRTAGVSLGKEGEEVAEQDNTEQTGYQYDDTMRLLGLSDALGNTYGHTYNDVDDLTQLQYPGNNASLQYGYDADHNLTAFTNARSQQSTFTLDPLDSRLNSFTRADNTQVSYQYDWAGRVSQISDANTILTYSYNAAGLISVETTNYLANNGSPDTEVDYFYNSDGSLNSINTVWGNYSYVYDNGGRLTDITLPWGDPIHYDYDSANRLTHQYVYDHETYYYYNALSQLIHQQVGYHYGNQFVEINDYNQFSYDAAGNLLGYTWTCPQLNYASNKPFSNSFSFQYDANDHLIQETSNGNLTSGWDPHGYNNTSYNWSHTSDAGDNLTQLRGFTFGSNVLDQVTSDSRINSATPFQYDADGNPTTFYGGACQFDTEGNLTSYTSTSVNWPNYNPVVNGTFTFGYRPDGRLAWRLDPNDPNGGKIYYLYIGGRVFHEYNLDASHNYSRTYGWGLTGLTETLTLSSFSGATDDFITTYSHDPLGSVSGHSYADPYYRSTYPITEFDLVSLYDAFGWTRGAWTVASEQPLLSTGDDVGWGGAWGAETVFEPGGGMYGAGTDGTGSSNVGTGQAGLMLLGYRFYSPATGRFLTRDPIGYDGGINLYAYTRNNPVNNADPLGLDPPYWQQVGQFVVGEGKGAINFLASSMIGGMRAMNPVNSLLLDHIPGANDFLNQASHPCVANSENEENGLSFGTALAFFGSFFLPGGQGNQAKALAEAEGTSAFLARMKAATGGMGDRLVVSARVEEAGETLFRSRIVSGPVSYLEKLYGKMASFMSHCENRAVRYIPLKPGQTLKMTATTKPPCVSCQGAMLAKAERTGADIIYRWRSGGKTMIWRSQDGIIKQY